MRKVALCMAVGMLAAPLSALAGSESSTEMQNQGDSQNQAQSESGTNLSETGSELSDSEEAVQRYYLAQQVAEYGRESGSATALLVAGEMIRGIEVSEEARDKTSEPAESASGSEDNRTDSSETADAGDSSEAPQAPTAEAFFTEARQMAGADKALTSRIDRAANRSLKGRVGGPTVHYDRVRARAADVYNIRYRGGELAHFAANGDGDTDLDLFVYDQNGNEVCRDTSYSDRMHCDWRPAWTGNFRIRIVNLGRVYNNYRLETN